MPTLDDARSLDRDDPLAALREAFVVDDDDVIYADGNSLGRLPRASRDAVVDTVDVEWGRGLVGSWKDWIDLPLRVGDTIGAAFLGAAPGQTVVADSTTVNFYKLAAAALAHAGPDRAGVVTDAANFPTDRFVLEGLAAAGDLVQIADPPTADNVDTALTRAAGRVGLVTFSHVDYRTAQLADMRAITQVAHAHGALVLWDLSHSVGAVEIALDACGVDLAVGCTYKYLNGGPGAPAFLYVADRLQSELRPVVQGWFGAAAQFAMGPSYEPAPGIRRFLAGTPPVLALRSLEAAVDTMASAGIAALAAKGRVMTTFVIDRASERLAAHGVTIATPLGPDRRGMHVALRHPQAWQICQAMIEDARVIPDFREPDIIRLGFAPAYTTFLDAFEAIERIADLLEREVHLTMPAERATVT